MMIKRKIATYGDTVLFEVCELIRHDRKPSYTPLGSVTTLEECDGLIKTKKIKYITEEKIFIPNSKEDVMSISKLYNSDGTVDYVISGLDEFLSKLVNYKR